MARTLQPEDVISHYRVVGPLGAGGMGEVYLARDTRLDRDVALKVLPAELVRSPDRVQRFIMEARSASSLSHPHIVAVHDIGHERVRSSGEAEPSGDEVHFIAMELITGKTLHELIHKDRADLRTLLGHLAQAAEGLSKAHAAGIVHRDLKPGNIMVTRDGYAKVLDFGLAKLTEKDVASADMTSAPTEAERTSGGALAGTVAYMSPEQVKGKSVDQRSDIFSFGCILYEAATRSRPFEADSSLDTMHRIAHAKPVAIEELNPEVPAELRRLIRRSLAKNPDQRLQSIKDLALELREIVDEFDSLSATATSASGGAPGPLPARRLPAMTAGIAALVVLGLAGMGFGLWSLLGGTGSSTPDRVPFQSVRMTSLLEDEGIEDAAISPDGRYLAYVMGPEGRWSLWVRQVATASDVQILEPRATRIHGLTFSPDGIYLYFLGADPETPSYNALFQVPSLGGTPRKHAFDVDTAISFSPDGTRAAFVRGAPQKNQSHLVLIDMSTREETVLVAAEQPEEIFRSRAAWSPDGGRVVVNYQKMTDEGYRNPLVAFDTGGASREILIPPEMWIGSFEWHPGGDGLVATLALHVGQRPQVAFVPLTGGDIRQITADLNRYSHVTITADGRSVAAVRTTTESSLWSVPAGGAGLRQLLPRSTTEAAWNFVPLEDGSLAFISSKGGYEHVWMLTPDGEERAQITMQSGWTWDLRAVPRGGGLIFNHFSDDESQTHIWRVDRDGSRLRKITTGSGGAMEALSPDGRTLLIRRPESRGELWRMPVEGGEPEEFVDMFIREVAFSPDGSYVGCVFRREIGGRIRNSLVILPSGGGAPLAERRMSGSWGEPRWLPSSSGISYVAGDGKVDNVWILPVDGGEPVQVTRFSRGLITEVEHAPDGSRMALVRLIDGIGEMWIAGLDGEEPVQVTHFGEGRVMEMAWSADGGSLFVAQGERRRAVVLIEDVHEE